MAAGQISCFPLLKMGQKYKLQGTVVKQLKVSETIRFPFVLRVQCASICGCAYFFIHFFHMYQ